jgi:hypothetical protein
LRANLTWKLGSRLAGSCLIFMLAIGIISCDAPSQQLNQRSTDLTSEISAPMTATSALAATDGPLSEVNTPDSIRNLAPRLEKFQPQVRILSPQSDEILADDRVTVKLKVDDLPLFKQPELGLGNHLHVILDKQTDLGVYDLSQPLVFKNLAAGTHTLRVFAERPWHESFKNLGANDLVTFHVLTKTAENNPDPQLPLLTYSRPAGRYGAEPIMLDYYLTNAPTAPSAIGSPERLADWRVRVTINEQKFILDSWAPIYLQGFKPGKNWVRLELIDARGNPIPNVYNDSIGIFTYDPQLNDSLAKLVRGDIDPNLALTLVDPNYTAINPSPTPAPIASVAPVPVNNPTPLPTTSVAPIPAKISTPTSIPSLAPVPVSSPSPAPTPSASLVPANPPAPIPTPSAAPVPAHTPTPILTPIVPSPIAILPAPITPSSPSPSAPQPSPSPMLVPIVPSPITAAPSANLAPTSELPRPAPIATPAPIPVASPPVPIPQSEAKVEKTWQTNAIEVFNSARAKTRAFTNTIPAKAQRFGRNLRIWGDKAIELVRELRDRKNPG